MEPTAENPAFSPDDIVQAVLLIDEGVNQGAYRGWEKLQQAATIRAKLLTFAQNWQAALTAQQPAAPAAPAAAEAEPEGETPQKEVQ